MLSNSSSSIQQRRKTHRRQQSLEVPILATPLPGHPHHRRNQHHGHKRGLSLDQSLSALNSPNGFRPLLPQDHSEPSGSPSVRIQLDTTNIGQHSHQHFVQETQQPRPSSAQPGYPPPDFSSHLQQQLQGNIHAPIDFKPVIASPQPHVAYQQQALQELQHHLEWYRSTYGHSPASNVATTPVMDMNMPMAAFVPGAPMHPAMMQQMPVAPQTPISQGHARTVPNTPQAYAQTWPSPPPSNAKHARSQSFQLDVAPMGEPGYAALPFTQQHNGFAHDSAAFTSDAGYASSAYSSSAVDPTSPHPPGNLGPMPTLFEEPTPPLDGHPAQGQFGDSSILLQATAGARDFNDPEFDFGGPVALSPRQQLLNNLGPDVPASIVETGVAAYEVQQYIGELSAQDNKYPCLWEGCSRRFGRKENVRAHVQTHLGDRQFMCNVCDKAFVRQHDLKRHIAIHSDDRPFVCPCGTGFARHDALTRHRQRGMCDGALPGFEKTEEEKPKRGRPKKERPDMESRVDKASKQRKKNKAKGSEGATNEEPELQVIYASSSSGASERSFPVTPPDTSDDFDADAFLNMTNGDMQFNTATSSWRDTPPTSPVSSSPTKTVDSFDPTLSFNDLAGKTMGISPAMLSTRSSPPVDAGAVAASTHTPESNHDIFDYSSPPGSNDAGGSFNGGSSPADMQFFNDFDAAVATQPDIGFDAFSPPGDSNGSSSVYNYSDNGADFMEKQLNDFATAHPDASMSETFFPNVDANSGKSLADLLDDWISAH